MMEGGGGGRTWRGRRRRCGRCAPGALHARTRGEEGGRVGVAQRSQPRAPPPSRDVDAAARLPRRTRRRARARVR